MSGIYEDEAEGRSYDTRLMRRFTRYLRPYRGAVAAMCVILLARVGADLAGPLILRGAVDGPVARGDIRGLTLMAALFTAFVAATATFEYFYTWIMNVVGQRVIFDLRLHLFGHLQRLPVSFFDRTSVGRLVVRITGDTENLSELFTSGLVELAADVILLAGAVVLMFVIHWKLALVTMMVSPAVLLASLYFRRTARERYREMRRRIGKLNAYLNESVGGMRTIQVFGREGTCLDRFRDLNAEYRDSAIGSIFAYSIFYPAIELLSSAAVALLVAYGGLSILGGSLSFGSFLAFWYCAHKFFQPVREIAEKYNILQAAMASAERIFRILDTPPAFGERPAAEPLPPLRGGVAFENVSFSYDGKTPVLENVSFRVEPGRSLAIVGLTGAGKTTIMNLLFRFYEPAAGRILIDGRDLRDYDVRAIRRRMGLVLQDVFLFGGTVEDNIRLGERSIPRERVEEAARAVHADGFIRRLPGGYATDVMERGAVLSMGERQLLSLARALASDPAVLVLDEATSNVDNETERLIQEGILRLMSGRTSIVVAHRLSTIRHADRILVLHRGGVREEGAHEELLRRDGLYGKLHRLQFRPAGVTP